MILPDFQETEYKIDGNDVYLKISSNTTKVELDSIAYLFKQEQNILIDYSKSNFKKNNRIKSLKMDVDFGDGKSGSISMPGIFLKLAHHGFSYERTDSSSFFTVGVILD